MRVRDKVCTTDDDQKDKVVRIKSPSRPVGGASTGKQMSARVRVIQNDE